MPIRALVNDEFRNQASSARTGRATTPQKIAAALFAAAYPARNGCAVREVCPICQAEFRHRLLRLLEQAGHRATAVATVSEATSIPQTETSDLLATDVVLTDGSSAMLTKQAEAAGAKTLMMAGNPDRIVDFDGARQPYLSKPFLPDIFLKRVEQILAPD
jgi:CheY-like chemotaxis protein